MVEDAEGFYRWAIKLFTKIMLRFEYHTRTNIGINDKFYGSHCDPLEGLGKLIILSGSNNRDKSCL